MYFGLGQSSDEKLCYKKIEWCFSYYHSTFSGSASRCQIIILFLKINFDKKKFENLEKNLFKFLKKFDNSLKSLKVHAIIYILKP
jgi:hypothetical protein